MNLIAEHIGNAIKAGKIQNPADLARRMNLQRSTVSRWISGEKAPSAEEARALAELLGIPEGMLMAECEAQRAKDDATRAAWLRVARWCQGQAANGTTAALLLIVLANYFFADGGETATVSMLWLGSIAPTTYYGVLLLVVTVTLCALYPTLRPPSRRAVI